MAEIWSGIMSDIRREEFVAEMNRLSNALEVTKSPMLRRDYSKAMRKMKRDLADYDRFQKERKAAL